MTGNHDPDKRDSGAAEGVGADARQAFTGRVWENSDEVRYEVKLGGLPTPVRDRGFTVKRRGRPGKFIREAEEIATVANG